MDEENDGLKHDRIHEERRKKRKPKVHRVLRKEVWENERELDRGVTVDPEKFRVTDKLIEEIANGGQDEEGTEDSVQERREPK